MRGCRVTGPARAERARLGSDLRLRFGELEHHGDEGLLGLQLGSSFFEAASSYSLFLSNWVGSAMAG